jgi:hypothetical protein
VAVPTTANIAAVAAECTVRVSELFGAPQSPVYVSPGLPESLSFDVNIVRQTLHLLLTASSKYVDNPEGITVHVYADNDRTVCIDVSGRDTSWVSSLGVRVHVRVCACVCVCLCM